VTRIIADENTVTGLELSGNGAKSREKFDLVVNAAGPFTWNILRESKIPSPEIMPSLGSMLVYDGRVTNSVLNRMRMPSDGDIIVPYGSSSILGTMATVVEDASSYTVDQEEIDSVQEEGIRMVPSLEKMPLKRVYSSVRPLISDGSGDPRSASRSFDIFDHSRDEYSGLLTITGGKYTTGRIIGQETARKVCEIFGSKFNPRNPELDTSFQRFRDSGMMLHGDIYDMVKSRSGTMDAERLIPGMALAVMESVSNRRNVK
jgi:glycerol-3-phosphate dehydrogenase